MFNEYSVFQMMKLRQEETERNASEAWKSYDQPAVENDTNEVMMQSNPSVNPCCQCVCA